LERRYTIALDLVLKMAAAQRLVRASAASLTLV